MIIPIYNHINSLLLNLLKFIKQLIYYLCSGSIEIIKFKINNKFFLYNKISPRTSTKLGVFYQKCFPRNTNVLQALDENVKYLRTGSQRHQKARSVSALHTSFYVDVSLHAPEVNDPVCSLTTQPSADALKLC